MKPTAFLLAATLFLSAPSFAEEAFYLTVTDVKKIEGAKDEPVKFNDLSFKEQNRIIEVRDMAEKIKLSETKIPEGTVVKTSRGYKVSFLDSGGNGFITKGMGEEFMIRNPKADFLKRAFYLYKGGMVYMINQKLYFEVHFRAIKVFVKGTKFEVVEKEAGKAVEVSVSENAVRVEQDYAVKIKETGETKEGFKKTAFLKAGQSEVFRLTYDEAWQTYKNYEEMAGHFEKQLRQSLDNKAEVETILADYNNLGMAYSDKGDLDKAMKSYDSGLSLAEKNKASDWFSSFYNNIGIVYSDKGDLDKALEFYGKAMKEKERSGVTGLNLGMTYNNIGLVYSDKGDLDRVQYKKVTLIKPPPSSSLFCSYQTYF